MAGAPLYNSQLRLPGNDMPGIQPQALPPSGGIERIGHSAAVLGITAGAVYQQAQRSTQQLQAARARTEFLSSAAELEKSFSEDDDAVTAPERFRAGLQAIETAQLATIEDHGMREAARLHMLTHALPAISRVESRAVRLQSVESRNGLNERRGPSVLAAAAAPTLVQRAAAIDAWDWDVNQTATAGWISGIEAQGQRRRAREEVAAIDARSAVETSPSDAVVALEADGMVGELARRFGVDSLLARDDAAGETFNEMPPTIAEFVERYGREPASDAELEHYISPDGAAYENFPNLTRADRQRLIDDAREREARQWRDARDTTVRDGYRMMAEGKVTQVWLDDNAALLDGVTYRQLQLSTEREPRTAPLSDTTVLHGLLDRAVDGDREARLDAADAYREGRLDRAGFARVLDNLDGFDREVEARPWLINLRRDLYETLRPEDGNDRAFDRADRSFGTWLAENENADEDAARGALRSITAAARASRSERARASLSLPMFTAAGRETISADELAGAATRLAAAHAAFQIDDAGFVQEVDLLRRWRDTIRDFVKEPR